MGFPWRDLPGAILGWIVGGIMSVIGGIIFATLPGGWVYVVILGAVDAAAAIGTVKHFLGK